MSNSMMKRILATIMVLCMAFSMMTIASAAEDYVVLKEATCTKTGVAKVTDAEGKPKYVVIPASHTKPATGTGVNRVEPTCAKDGSETYACTECEETVTDVIPATGNHSYVDKVLEATCTEPTRVGSFCEVCDAQEPGTEVMEADEPKGHDYVLDVDDEAYVAATCTEGGVDVMVCSVCSDRYTEETEAKGHTPGDSDYLSADCENNGREVVFCAVCEEPIETNDMGALDPAIGHKPQEAVRENEKDVTCGEDGSYDLVVYCANTSCPRENNELSRETVTTPSTGDEHHYALTATLKEATCTTSGIGKHVCSVCDKAKYEVIPAAHAWKNVGNSTATCTEAGTQEQECDVCHETQTIDVPARGHNWGEGVETTPATCGKDGEMTYTCTACPETKTEAIPATGEHSYMEKVLEATCTEPSKVGSFCQVCDAQEPGTEVKEVGEPAGHDYKLKTDDEAYKAATCTEGGVDVMVCSVCSDRYTEETEAKGHTPGDSEYLPADCENNGRDVVFCAVCEEIIETNDMGNLDPAIGHDPQEAVEENVKPVTCGEDGSYDLVVYCANTNCPKENHELSRETVTTSSTGNEHLYVLTATLKEATCTTSGIGKHVCSVCDKAKYEVIPAAHDWKDSGESTATCTEAGTQEQECSVCGEKQTIDVPELGHKWGEGVGTIPATCGEDGEMTYTCGVCGETKTEVIPATGVHTFAEEYVIEATCTEPMKVGIFCGNCGAQKPDTEFAEVGEPAGHAYELKTDDEAYKAATCTEGGVDVKVCSVCGDRVTEETEPKGHTPGDSEYLQADCENNGREVVRCTVCEEIIETNDVGTADPATGHDLVVEVIEPTCKEGGYTLTTCTQCDFSEKTDPTDADLTAHQPIVTVLKEKTCTASGINKLICKLCGHVQYEAVPAGHNLGEATMNPEATCTEDGLKISTCTVCGEEVEEVIPATGHEYVDVVDQDGKVYQWCTKCYDEIHCKHEATEVLPAVDPTCTEAGLTEGKKCSACGEILTAQETVEALGHAEEVVPGKAATCTEAGLTEGSVCTVCGETMKAQETIEAPGHTEEIVPGKDATCTETGLTAGKKCSVCGETLTAQEETAALDHAYGEEQTDETGAAYKECAVCGHKEYINVHEHTPQVVPGKAPTCTETGLTEGSICSECGETLTAQEAIEALGHNEEVVPGKAPTCTEAGLTEGKKCSVCGEILTAQEELAALSHQYTSSWSFNSDFTKKIKTSTCSVCGDIITEEFVIE